MLLRLAAVPALLSVSAKNYDQPVDTALQDSYLLRFSPQFGLKRKPTPQSQGVSPDEKSSEINRILETSKNV